MIGAGADLFRRPPNMSQLCRWILRANRVEALLTQWACPLRAAAATQGRAGRR